MRDGTAEPVSRDQILRRVRGQRNGNFPCSADHEQDWQPHPVDPNPVLHDDQTYLLGCGSFVRGRKRMKVDSRPFYINEQEE